LPGAFSFAILNYRKGFIMLISVTQLNQLHTNLQEYPTATEVVIRSETNGSGIGPSEFADYYETARFPFAKPKLLGTVEITDYGLW
jgi:hypothetical protein